jgi:hypothetical protein
LTPILVKGNHRLKIFTFKNEIAALKFLRPSAYAAIDTLLARLNLADDMPRNPLPGVTQTRTLPLFRITLAEKFDQLVVREIFVIQRRPILNFDPALFRKLTQLHQHGSHSVRDRQALPNRPRFKKNAAA